MKIVLLGMSSSPPAHAASHAALVRGLRDEAHDVVLDEGTATGDLRERVGSDVADADLVVVRVDHAARPDVLDWVASTATGVTALYDTDVPRTLASGAVGDVARFDLYLSSSGGPALRRLEAELGVRRAVEVGWAVDPEVHRPLDEQERWDLGHIGDGLPRPQLEPLLVEPARRSPTTAMVLAGAPPVEQLPRNVEQIDRLPVEEEARLYSSVRAALVLSGAPADGWTPPPQLFEAAACGVPVISDGWRGLDAYFDPGRDVFIARSPFDLLELLEHGDADELREVGERGRSVVLDRHTAAARVSTLVALASDPTVDTDSSLAGA